MTDPVLETIFEQLQEYYEPFKKDRKLDVGLINDLLQKNYLTTDNQFYYIYDYQKLCPVFVSENVYHVLGYHPEDFTFKKTLV